ncbi:unnamed protein product [Lactuca virosa]|uniref:Uncharacterized protein n=1 Tax=Lactuca virosa TaxID=75947 RepID=A0AAU9P9G0_9ASTR|nr:unnamed protein product [Lactuca virosa]
MSSTRTGRSYQDKNKEENVEKESTLKRFTKSTARRCSPGSLLSVIQGFSDVQKDYVRKMGFGDLLKMKMIDVPGALNRVSSAVLKVKRTRPLICHWTTEKVKMREDYEKEEIGEFGTGELNEEFIQEELNEKDYQEMILMKCRKFKLLIDNGIYTFPQNTILNHLKSSFIEILNDEDGDDEDNEDDKGGDNEENEGDNDDDDEVNDDHNNEKVNDDEDVEGCENNQGGDINDVQKKYMGGKSIQGQGEEIKKTRSSRISNMVKEFHKMLNLLPKLPKDLLL